MIPLSRPSIGDAEVQAVERVLRSGWLSSGKVVEEFERKVAELSECRYGVACMSGTDALHLMLRGSGVGPYDEVIVPSMTFCATVNAVVRTGARPVFADIDRQTLCLDPESVRAAMSPRTKAVIPVHFGGAPCAPGGSTPASVLPVGCQGVPFQLADGAHALGASAEGRPAAVWSNATAYSFHPTKGITTGEGGMVVTDDCALAVRMRRLRFHGLDMYREVSASGPGYKSNLPDVLAAIGLAQLDRLEENNARRRTLAARYRMRLAESGLSAVTVPQGPAFQHVHARHLMSVLVDFERYGCSRGGVIQAMAFRGVEVGVHYVAVHLHPYYRGLYPDVRLPVTELVSEQILSLPVYPDMSDDDVDVVVGALVDVLVG